MNVRRSAGGILALVDALFGLYLAYEFTGPYGLLFSLSVLLMVDSFLCIYGLRFAFLAAAILSIVLPAGATLVTSLAMDLQLALLLLSLVSMIANVIAFRSRTEMSEQTNPMNLPVFG